MKNLRAPEFARCDRCGRNTHKVAVLLTNEVLRNRQLQNDERAKRNRHKPLKAWPVEGWCPSCWKDRTDSDPDFPSPFGTVLYDRRGR